MKKLTCVSLFLTLLFIFLIPFSVQVSADGRDPNDECASSKDGTAIIIVQINGDQNDVNINSSNTDQSPVQEDTTVVTTSSNLTTTTGPPKTTETTTDNSVSETVDPYRVNITFEIVFDFSLIGILIGLINQIYKKRLNKEGKNEHN